MTATGYASAAMCRRAGTPEERDLCLRIRAEAFQQEGSPSAWRPQSDPLDDDAVLLLGFVNGRPTSTVRVNCGDHRRNPYRALYGLDEPGLRLSGGIAIYSKLAILPEFRHGSALLCLSRSAFRAALEEGARVSLLGCRKELLRMYERFGFRRYRSPQQVAGHGLIYPLRLDHEEQAFSAHPRSPLLPVLRDFVRSPAAARWSS